MKKLNFLIFITICTIVLTSFATEINSQPKSKCKNEFKDKKFRLSICLNKDWKAEERGPYLIISKEKIKISIYKEKLSSNKSAKEIAKAAAQKDLNDDTYKELKLIKEEEIIIDGEKGYLIQTHGPKRKTNTSFQREITFTTIYFNYKGFSYAVNNNCYSDDCEANETMIKEVITQCQLK